MLLLAMHLKIIRQDLIDDACEGIELGTLHRLSALIARRLGIAVDPACRLP
jgi:hypothetical protein